MNATANAPRSWVAFCAKLFPGLFPIEHRCFARSRFRLVNCSDSAYQPRLSATEPEGGSQYISRALETPLVYFRTVDTGEWLGATGAGT
jgi:hypothetical protein